MTATDELSDSALVKQSLQGNSDAFRLIIERYQNLISSITFSICGNFTTSQDLAQETFVQAWKNLAQLEDGSKLKPWICTIARHLSSRAMGRSTEKIFAGPDVDPETEATMPSPSQTAITNEEEQLVWKTLEQIPENYREPLILFYREQQSIEKVAQSMDLSVDAVKQRLSRGRRMLKEQVAAQVESTLTRSAPGRSFALGVLAVTAGLGSV